MTKAQVSDIGRKEYNRIIEKAITLDEKLFNPLTIKSISAIERQLGVMHIQTGKEYVAVCIGQPYGGPKTQVAMPLEDVYLIHTAYKNGQFQGASPEVGRTYDLQTERQRIIDGKPAFNSDDYPPKFVGFLRKHFYQTK